MGMPSTLLGSPVPWLDGLVDDGSVGMSSTTLGYTPPDERLPGGEKYHTKTCELIEAYMEDRGGGQREASPPKRGGRSLSMISRPTTAVYKA